MKENIGRLLDIQDYEKAVPLGKKDYFSKNINQLREICMGKVIAKMHSKNTTLLSGQSGSNILDFAPFLYFHDSVILDLCPGCPQAVDPTLLEPYLERGLATVIARTSYQNYNDEFQNLASTYPECFVGPCSFVIYLLFTLNDEFPHSPGSEFCLQCSIRDKMKAIKPQIMKMKKYNRELLGDMTAVIENMPVLDAESAVDLLIDTVNKPTPHKINELESTVNLMSYLTNVNGLKSIPQFNSDFLGKTDLLLKGLRINHRTEIDLEQYLDLVKSFKGTLPHVIIPKNKEKILSKIIEINEEVEKIQSSKRATLASFFTAFIPNMASVLTRVVTQGTYGAEGVYKKAVSDYKSPRLTKIKSKILSKYYGVSEVGAQIWQIRQKIKKIG